MPLPMLKVNQIRRYFKDVKAVDGISFELRQGEFLALLGPNGAGKTTTVEMIEGLQQPDSGGIFIDGKTWLKNRDELHRILGISLQETRFIDKLTVFETLKLFAGFYGLDNHRVNEIIDLTGLESKRKVYTKNLSGGQLQKLALGIALINKARFLLLDEPTTGLDPAARREIWNVLMKLKSSEKVSMILTTHYMEEAEYLCDRIIIMDQGKILASGTLSELLYANKSNEIIEFGINKPLQTDILAKMEGVINLNFDRQNLKGTITVENIVVQLPVILDIFNRNGYQLTWLECRKLTLDDLFISLTGKHLND